ncbi:hypothetical protein HDR63_04440 [bacterium]|nr:hypothetical protein [bacterium]
MTLTVRLLDIPYESLGRGRDGSYDKNAPRVRGTSKFLNIMDRIVIVADVNGVRVPFYLSTGAGGKQNVPAGKWYPFFGIGPDWWMNKLHDADIAAYYHSDVLKKICQQLDIKLGDIRDRAADYPTTSLASTQTRDFINAGFDRVTENETPGAPAIVAQNVSAIRAALDRAAPQNAWQRRAARVPTGPQAPWTPDAGHSRD